ncbi:MAG: exosortase family protein XrtF [Bacteroidia bacterium]|nr:exosortase family protein XrtF [Bacteroidia bacterium]
MIPTINRSPVNRFVFRASVVFILWFILYYVLEIDKRTISKPLSQLVVEQTTWLLSFIDVNYHLSIEQRGKYILHTVCYDTKCLVGVGRGCNALELFVLFAGFIMAFPGAVKNKVWYIMAGIVLIHILNVCRVAALAVIQFKAPQYLDFNHRYTFTFLVYGVIFILWIIWVKRYSNTGNEKVD